MAAPCITVQITNSEAFATGRRISTQWESRMCIGVLSVFITFGLSSQTRCSHDARSNWSSTQIRSWTVRLLNPTCFHSHSLRSLLTNRRCCAQTLYLAYSCSYSQPCTQPPHHQPAQSRNLVSIPEPQRHPASSQDTEGEDRPTLHHRLLLPVPNRRRHRRPNPSVSVSADPAELSRPYTHPTQSTPRQRRR
jgi:hypothetical protein